MIEKYIKKRKTEIQEQIDKTKGWIMGQAHEGWKMRLDELERVEKEFQKRPKP